MLPSCIEVTYWIFSTDRFTAGVLEDAILELDGGLLETVEDDDFPEGADLLDAEEEAPIDGTDEADSCELASEDESTALVSPPEEALSLWAIRFSPFFDVVA